MGAGVLARKSLIPMVPLLGQTIWREGDTSVRAESLYNCRLTLFSEMPGFFRISSK